MDDVQIDIIFQACIFYIDSRFMLNIVSIVQIKNPLKDSNPWKPNLSPEFLILDLSISLIWPLLSYHFPMNRVKLCSKSVELSVSIYLVS